MGACQVISQHLINQLRVEASIYFIRVFLPFIHLVDGVKPFAISDRDDVDITMVVYVINHIICVSPQHASLSVGYEFSL